MIESMQAKRRVVYIVRQASDEPVTCRHWRNFYQGDAVLNDQVAQHRDM